MKVQALNTITQGEEGEDQEFKSNLSYVLACLNKQKQNNVALPHQVSPWPVLPSRSIRMPMVWADT